MEDDIYKNRCIAIKKFNHDNINNLDYKINLRCKSNKKQNSVFCGVHNNHKPQLVSVILQSVNNIKEWMTIRFTNEKDIICQIKTIKENLVKKALDKILKETEQINSIITCKVCEENVILNSELIRCTKATFDNHHLICNTCINGHIDSLISDGIASYCCMFDKSDKCGGEYLHNDIIKVITSNLETPNLKNSKQKTWDELINISEIHKIASICDDYVICPLCCKWGCIYETPVGYKGTFYIPCDKCGETWCNLCKRKSHSDRSCYKLEFEDNENIEKRIEIIDHMIQELVTKSLMHCCSTCGCSYIKEEGCNLMMCPKCDSMSCYLCNMKLYFKNNTKYWHFTGHDLSDRDAKCVLWNNVAGDGKINQGNTDFNEKSVIRELMDFIRVNNDEIAKLICQRISYIYNKDIEYKKIVSTFKNALNIMA